MEAHALSAHAVLLDLQSCSCILAAGKGTGWLQTAPWSLCSESLDFATRPDCMTLTWAMYSRQTQKYCHVYVTELASHAPSCYTAYRVWAYPLHIQLHVDTQRRHTWTSLCIIAHAIDSESCIYVHIYFIIFNIIIILYIYTYIYIYTLYTHSS